MIIAVVSKTNPSLLIILIKLYLMVIINKEMNGPDIYKLSNHELSSEILE